MVVLAFCAGAAYAATYTVDGQFGTGANATKGREALKKMVRQVSMEEIGKKPEVTVVISRLATE